MKASVHTPLTKHGVNRTIGFQLETMICFGTVRSTLLLLPGFDIGGEVLREGNSSQAASPPREGSSH
jgi:hypothetical protein